MRHLLFCLLFFTALNTAAQSADKADLVFGNVHYYNVSLGDAIQFSDSQIEVLEMVNHHIRLRVDADTLWMKVARRSPALRTGSIQLFVADAAGLKRIAPDEDVHGLLSGDVLLGIAKHSVPLIDRLEFVFPVGFTGGFIWRNNEDKGVFSYPSVTDDPAWLSSYGGWAIDIFSRRGAELHPLVAVENSRVIWIESRSVNNGLLRYTICLQSESQPDIYFIYDHLESAPSVRRNQRVVKGEQLAHAKGAVEWSTLRFSVVMRPSPPEYRNRFAGQLNIFPQLLELYYGQQPGFVTHFTKGQIFFGRGNRSYGHANNISAYENHLGMGWVIGSWNITDRVEWVNQRRGSNARLRRHLFAGEAGESANPVDYFDYQISVRNGVYRVRALVGDYQEASWQRIEFEGVSGGTFSREAGDMVWTSERVVRVTDGTLTVRIYVDDIKPAGISEIVFQEAAM